MDVPVFDLSLLSPQGQTSAAEVKLCEDMAKCLHDTGLLLVSVSLSGFSLCLTRAPCEHCSSQYTQRALSR